MRTGKGIFKWITGTVYEGEFSEDIIKGKGKKTYSNGEVVEGNWNDGKLIEKNK